MNPRSSHVDPVRPPRVHPQVVNAKRTLGRPRAGQCWLCRQRRPTPTRASRSRLAFTILELMLAISIFAIVLTAIYAIWIAILRGSKAGLKAAAEVQRSRIALRALEDAFTSAEYFMANMNHYLFF